MPKDRPLSRDTPAFPYSEYPGLTGGRWHVLCLECCPSPSQMQSPNPIKQEEIKTDTTITHMLQYASDNTCTMMLTELTDYNQTLTHMARAWISRSADV